MSPVPDTRKLGLTVAGSRPSRVAGPPLLVCGDVRKVFRGLQALGGVSLEVREGEILGLLGPNGSCKSTLINVVSGHHRAGGGRIVAKGVRIVRQTALEKLYRCSLRQAARGAD
ncbi:MAG: ATP-binding cassette domain-containing protein [Acidobacteria bacterium]|nr:ATP-binding cassette domain-containing protein [Acidobacteriota bacterium]